MLWENQVEAVVLFHIMPRIFASLPMASLLIGLLGQATLLLLPPALTALYVLRRDRIIRRRVGRTAWPSDGFARHVLVDDLARLICVTLLGLPLFFAGYALRMMLPAA
ncbi:hypothetical protein PSC71_02150 [Devosia sp. J2-20]|jgi:hypothetical protein|uniref:hypothetical protein n=1 Tax=Devosia TaxID=46913 RepID=UPI0022B04BDE|nr:MULTISPECIES: hypothetical protein [Devosia]MCZ4346600.1 hypothetical protein [Devosia neptuniae]WDQ99633.1 hypothetical protein PSC71_02150 [Devosia sp. J2-20]|tara:strand:+ start:8984 stop:9307 length:324 start_codon:yes stop_codon:yes gene_type:complete